MGYYYWQIPGRLIEFTAGVALAGMTFARHGKSRKIDLKAPFTLISGILLLLLISNLVNRGGVNGESGLGGQW